MHNSKFFRKLSLAFILAVALALTVTSLALAQQGPVSEPPGGVTVTQTGACTGAPNYDIIGECQGRTGGLDLTYTNFDFSQFQDLYWGAAYLSDARLRLNGYDWFGYMGYQAADSNLPGGMAVFRGNTDIPLWNGGGYSYTYVNTRFTVTVTDLGGNPLPLEEPGSVGDLSTNGPLLHVTGDFRANILFEFYYGGAWMKALEGYDSLHTPPSGGLVNSSYTPRFFYTDVPLEGLSATNDSPTPYGSTTILTATVLTGTNPVYAWDFGDGTLGSGAVTGHIYPATGSFTAVVTATNEANVLTATTFITIIDAPVIGLSASNDSPTHLGDFTTLQASATGGSNITYTWALGDGAFAAGQVVTHTYPSAGYYTALVTATNVLNQITATTTVTISFEVLLTDPAANELAVAATAPLTVTFTGDVAPGTVSTATLAASGAFTGPRSGSFSFPASNQAVFSPSAAYLPGELVTVQVLTDVQSTLGQSLYAPYQWQFSAAVAGGSGNFVNSGQSLPGPSTWRVNLGDLDGDGDLDALTVDYMIFSSQVWLNDGSGFYTPYQTISTFPFPTDVALGDLDGDGDLDAFIVGIGGAQEVWFNDGSAIFTLGQTLSGSASYAVNLGDLDGDGDLDAFVATYNGEPDRVFFNNGAGSFVDSGQALGAEYGIGMALGDVDNDGDLDAYVANCHDTATDKLWLNDGQGQFSDSGQVIDGLCSYDADLGDVDGDGDLDAVVANAAAGGQPNQLFVNDGNGTWSNSGQNLGSYQSTGIKLGDLDADGDLDLFYSTFDAGQHVWLNDGSGIFTDTLQVLGTAVSRGMALGDLDGDGDLDAFVAADGSPSEVWFNENSADLAIAKSGSPALPQPGGWVTYTLSFANLGPQTATGVQIVDQIPVSVTHSSLSVSSNLPITPTGTFRFTWLLPDLAPGASGMITITGQLSDSLPSGHTFTNTASISALEWDLAPANNQSLVSLTTNLAPLAAAGPDQDVDTGETVTLDGRASLDLDGNLPLTYHWVQTSGPTVSFNPTLSLTTFTAPGDPVLLNFVLIVTDSLDQPSRPDPVAVTVHNQPPLADAGADQTVDTLAFVTLDGSGSDPDNDLPLAYLWTQTAGAPVTLSDPSAAAPTFTAPDDPGILTLTLIVTDSWGLASTPDTVVITVANQAPLADAGADQTVDTLALVTLNGSASYDPDNDTLAYLWTQTAGPAVTLSDPSAASPTFTAPGDPAVLTFTLMVTDSFGLPAPEPDEVAITVNNQPPLADAGTNQTVSTMVPVMLDGSLSTDPDGNLPLAYLWMQTAGTPVTLSDPAATGPTFTAPGDPAVLTFALIVTDSLGLASAPDEVVITVNNQPPLVDAGVDQTLVTLALVTLDGSGSDPDGDLPLAYLWTQTAGAPVTLSEPVAAGPTFTAPDDPAVLIFTLIVTDSLGLASTPDTVAITITNQPPVADAGADQNLDTLALVTLDGSASYDPDNDALTYLWTQTAGPAVTLSDSAAASPTFTAPGDPAALTFALIVTDSWGLASAPDAVVITIANQAPVAHAGADQIVRNRTLVTLDGSLSSDPDGDLPLTYLWVQIGGPAVTLSNPTVVTPTFTAPAVQGTLTFALIVTDNLGLASVVDEVTVTIESVQIYLPMIMR